MTFAKGSIFKFLLFILILNSVLFACSGVGEGGGLLDPTATASVTFTFTPTNCPPVVLDKTPVPGTIKPYLIIALFEDTPESHTKTNQDILMLQDIFREVAEPGDYVLMMRMEPATLSSATFFQEKITLVPPPPIPPLPTKYPTFTPIPQPTSTPDTTLAQTAQANHVTETVAASLPTATYQAFLHQCAMNEWDFQFRATQTSHELEVEEVIEKFREKILPLSTDPISSTAVWNGLAHATIVLENECNNYQRCILLIFSDMDETYTEPRESEIHLPLQNGNKDKTEVLVLMRNCQFLYSGSCSKWKSFWENFFASRSTPTSFINSNIEEAIEAVIKR